MQRGGGRRLAPSRPTEKRDGFAADRHRAGVQDEQPALTKQGRQGGAEDVQAKDALRNTRGRIHDDPGSIPHQDGPDVRPGEARQRGRHVSGHPEA